MLGAKVWQSRARRVSEPADAGCPPRVDGKALNHSRVHKCGKSQSGTRRGGLTQFDQTVPFGGGLAYGDGSEPDTRPPRPRGHTFGGYT